MLSCLVVVDDPFLFEVPTEDPRSQLEGALAKLVGSLYGTRDAPLIWQDCLRCEMKSLGFKARATRVSFCVLCVCAALSSRIFLRWLF